LHSLVLPDGVFSSLCCEVSFLVTFLVHF
jgi:hypothetical protein